jgi:hypothetical protein
MPCGKTEGGVKPRVQTAKAPRPFSRERRLGISPRREGLLASGYPAAPEGPPPYSPRLPARALVTRAVAPLRISSPVTVAGQRWTRTIFPCPDGNVPICATILPPGGPCVKAESPMHR